MNDDIEAHRPRTRMVTDRAASQVAIRRPSRCALIPANRRIVIKTKNRIKPSGVAARKTIVIFAGPFRLVQLRTNHSNTSPAVVELCIIKRNIRTLESADERHQRTLRQAHADSPPVPRDATTNPVPPRGLRSDLDTWTGGRWLPAQAAISTIFRGRSV